MSAKHDLGPIWVFDQSSLESALESYRQEAETAYPHQAERIRITVAAMRDFLHSEHARGLMMKPGSQ